MSRHWIPDEDVARVRAATPRRRWPEGATAGVTVVALSCVGLAVLLYRLAGPRDIFGQ
jgi:hypothetical protein